MTGQYSASRVDEDYHLVDSGGHHFLMMVIMAAAIVDVESFAPAGNIYTPSHALWWALTIVTSIGDHDKYPVTEEGHRVAAPWIIFGPRLLRSLSGYFARWVIQKVPEAGVKTATARPHPITPAARRCARG